MIKVIGIDMGHTISGANYGSVGIKKESIETRAVGKKVIETLRSLGYTVIDCTVDNAASNGSSLSARVNKANAQKLDLFVSIHFNASPSKKGEGTEIFTYNAKQLPEAISILNNIVALGFRNRGIKDGSHLYVVKNTKAPAMLVECAFIDNDNDMKLYNSEKMAKVIAEGIVGKKIDVVNAPIVKPITPTPVAKPEPIQLKPDNSKVAITKLLQKAIGVVPDGIIGPKTLGALPLLKQGSKGNVVKLLQQILNVSSDGIFGTNTRNAVIKLQKATGLSPDGIVGQNTWSKLI